MKHIAIYIRVSSRKQDTRSQEPDLNRWVEAFADAPVKWYKDKKTGKTMDRPGWKRLEADIIAGKVSKIVVWRSASVWPRPRSNASRSGTRCVSSLASPTPSPSSYRPGWSRSSAHSTSKRWRR